MCLDRKLTIIQQVIIEIARNEGCVTPKAVMKRYNITYRRLQENFYKLEDQGLLERIHEWKLEYKAA